MKRFNFKHFFLLIFLGLLVAFPSAFSSWIIYDVDGTTLINSATLTPVCYIDSDTDSNKYYSIEKALSIAKSGQTVYVIPETNPKIKYDCTIKSGVVLTIGGLTKGGSYIKDDNNNYIYADRGVKDESSDTSAENSVANRGPHVSSNKFADSDANNVSTYRKNCVTLDAKLTISSSARLNIAGRLGVETAGLSGMTSGDYCEILMTNSGKIENYGIIDCYGFIKQSDVNSTSYIHFYDGSELYEPFTICDFNGGTYSVTCNQKKDANKVMPFNQWLMCNVQVRQIYEYNSFVFGYYDVYNSKPIDVANLVSVKKGHKHGKIDVIGTSNSIININNGGKIEVIIETDNIKFTTFISYIVNKRCAVNFYGSCEIEKMLIPNPMPDLKKFESFTNVEISDADSSKYFFGFCHYFTANIYGTLTVKTKQKVLPGCEINVMEGGTLNINADFIVYEDLDEKTAGATKAYLYPTKFNQNVDVDNVKNAIINDGTININGCSFGGKIYSNVENAILNLSGSSSLTVTSREMASGAMEIQYIPPKANFNATYQSPDKTEVARGPLINGETFSIGNFGSSVYVSTSLNSDIGWKLATDLDSYNIIYHLNGGTTTIEDGYSGTYYMIKGSTLVLTSVPVPSPFKEYYNFEGWYLDSSLTNNLSNGVSVSNGLVLNVYAKYIDVSYSIEYNVTNDTGIAANIINPNESLNSINKTMFDNNSGSIHISECTSDSDMLEFDGWYTSSDYNFANKLIDNNIVELKDYKLYGRFVKIRPKVTFEGISINGVNTFTVGEDGKLSKSIISDIYAYLDNLKTDSDISTYCSSFSYGEIQYSFDEITNSVFTENSTVICNFSNKYSITYNNLTTSSIIKYYLRDSNNSIIGNPIIEDLDQYNNGGDRQSYQWEYNNVGIKNSDLISYLNKNPSLNNITLKMIWKYKLIVTVESCGTKALQITCDTFKTKTFSSSKDNYSDYIIPGETLKLNIDSFFGGVSSTKALYKSNGVEWTIQNSLFSGDSKTQKMPESVVTITVQKG